jgi:hypothetical protein
MRLENVGVFNKDWEKYDAWYDRNPAVFQSELKAISSGQAVLPLFSGFPLALIPHFPLSVSLRRET